MNTALVESAAAVVDVPGVAAGGVVGWSGVATERLEAELVSHAAWEASGMARVLDVLAEWDARRGWEGWGCVSAQQWLSWQCGLGTVAASERLRVARALRDLPHLRQGLAQARLSCSKVRALTRVATPATDRTLADLGASATAAMIARIVGSLRKRTPRDAVSQLERRGMRWEVDESDGSVVFTMRVPTDDAMTVIAAVEAAAVFAKGAPGGSLGLMRWWRW